MNNATLSRADRATHLKVVAVTLAASIAVIAVSVGARTMSADSMQSAHGPVIKAAKPMIATVDGVTTIR